MSKLTCLIAIVVFWCSFLMGQTKVLENFNSISCSGNVQVELVRGNTPKADYKILKGNEEDLVLQVKNSELIVKTKSNVSFWNRSNAKAKVTVYYQNLVSIDCSSGATLEAKNEILTSTMDIETSSGSSCSVKLNTNHLEVSASSGSSLTMFGSCTTIDVDGSSGASIDASNLKAAYGEADASSGASISVNVFKKLTADAGSGGSIKYKGKPENVNFDSGVSGSISSF